MKLENLSVEEQNLTLSAERKYGVYFQFARFAIDFAHSTVVKVKSDGVFFLLFYNQVMKHVRLACLSAVRLHHVQANFDLRYAHESGAWAAFAIAHHERSDFADLQPGNLLEPTQTVKEKMYNWIETNYPDGNKSLKQVKKQFNALSSHANIVDAFRNYGGMKNRGMHVGFFDSAPDHHVKTDLWSVGNLIMGLLDLFYGVNRDYKVIQLQPNFLELMNDLRVQNNGLKTEMLSHSRLARYAKK